MARNYSKGIYNVLNKKKYVGRSAPIWRSSWENRLMYTFDTHPSILAWASEPVRIPYRHPLTGKNTTYVPDFLIQYQKADGSVAVELIEVKPAAQSMIIEGKKMRPQDMAVIAVNFAKWQSARAWCAANHITFRVVTENDIFMK